MLRTRLLQALALVGLASSATFAEFSTCRFNFGVDWNQHIGKNCSYYRPNCSNLAALQIPDGIDFLGAFIGWTQDGETKLPPEPMSNKEGLFITDAKALNATPMWKAYIIAEGAKTAMGLTDCNVGGGSGTLCQKGANYIRTNRATILSQYRAYAKFAAAGNRWGTTKPFIWALEPDFVQYTDGSQQGGGISYADAKLLLSDIIDVVKSEMPNALISMDISPWKDQAEIIPAMIPVSKIDFMNTSGGVSQPGGTIKDITTWSSVWNLTKKGIIADDGYGTAGVPTNPNPGWTDVNNLKARINDGVIGLYEAVPPKSWGTTIAGLRASLPELKTCGIVVVPTTPKYTLTITAPLNGSIAASPVATTYDSGTSVTLTATAAANYRFSAWTGASTATTSPVTIVMNGNKTIGATFVSSAKPKYTLTVTAPTNGTITLSPAGGSYDSGTTVTATATAIGAFKFSAWTGASTATTSPVGIVMNGNKTLGATFVADNGPVALTVSATTNGTVTMSPAMPSGGYARGTVVTLTAVPAVGYDFVAWSGALTGSVNPSPLTMDAAKTVGATFRKQGEVTSSLKGGDCANLTDWTAWGLYNNGWAANTQLEPGNATNSVCYVKDNNYQPLPDTTFKLTQKNFQLTGGVPYFVSFRARVEKRDDMRGQHPIGVRVLVNGTQVYKKSDSIPQDTVWHKFQYTFTPANSGAAQFDLLLGGGNQLSWQGVFLDDIAITDAPVSVGARAARKVGTLVRYAQGTIFLSVKETKPADVSLLTPSGRVVADFGSHDFSRGEMGVKVDGNLEGLHLMVLRGEGWQAVAPVILGR
jgi:hypothetical protein